MRNEDVINDLYMAEFREANGNLVKYDTRMYHTTPSNPYLPSELRYNSDYKGVIKLPEGLINGHGLFSECRIKPGCTFDSEGSSSLTNAAYMFAGCKFPDNFELNLDTSNVTNMTHMLQLSNLGSGFKFGPEFDTSEVTDMTYMLEGCNMGPDFKLPENFDTSKTLCFDHMLQNCDLSDNFTMPDKFDTRGALSMSHMFENCRLPENFKFSPNFTTQNSNDVTDIFKNTTLPNGMIISGTPNIPAIIRDFKDESVNHDTPIYNSLLRQADKQSDNSVNYDHSDRSISD